MVSECPLQTKNQFLITSFVHFSIVDLWFQFWFYQTYYLFILPLELYIWQETIFGPRHHTIHLIPKKNRSIETLAIEDTPSKRKRHSDISCPRASSPLSSLLRWKIVWTKAQGCIRWLRICKQQNRIVLKNRTQFTSVPRRLSRMYSITNAKAAKTNIFIYMHQIKWTSWIYMLFWVSMPTRKIYEGKCNRLKGLQTIAVPSISESFFCGCTQNYILNYCALSIKPMSETGIGFICLLVCWRCKEFRINAHNFAVNQFGFLVWPLKFAFFLRLRKFVVWSLV